MTKRQVFFRGMSRMLLAVVLVWGLSPTQGLYPVMQANADEPEGIEVYAESLSVANATKQYGNPDPQYMLLGLPNGLVQGVDYTVVFQRYNTGETVNTTTGYGVRVTSLTFLNPNYALDGEEEDIGGGRLYITTRAITVTANSASKVYDNTPLTSNGYTIGGSGLAPGNTATVTITGTRTIVGSTANTVGTVVIRQGTTVVTSNYTVTKVNGTLTITKRPLTVTADDKVINFGDPPPAYTLTYAGFVSGQGTANLTTLPTATSTYTTGSAAGNYPITASGGSATNYSFVYQSGTLTVRPNTAAITVTALSSSKVYDGSALTEPGYTVSNLPSGYTLTTAVSGSITDVVQSGTGNNVVGAVVIKRNSDNVDVTASFSNIVTVNGSLTVTPAPLTAEVTDMTIVYGDPVPLYAVSYAGFVNGETASVLTNQTSFVGTYTVGDDSGNYSITGTGASAANYTINYISGTLTVAKNPTLITVTAAHESKVYDGTPLVNSNYNVVTGSGMPANHTIEVTVVGSATDVADSGSANNLVSTVIIKNGDGQDVTANFSNLVTIAGGLVITPAPLTIEVDDKTILFDQPAPTYTATYTGFMNGETQTVLTTPVSFTDNYTQGDPAGTYSITGADAAGANYAISYLQGDLTVHPDSSYITIAAHNASKVYDGTPIIESGYSEVGLPAGYTLSGVTVASLTPITNVNDDGTSVNQVTTYSIIRDSDLADVTANFSNVVLVPGSLSITPAPLTIEMIDYVVSYGSASPGYAVTYTGFIPGEDESNALSNLVVPACAYTQTTTAGTTLPITQGAGTTPTNGNYAITYLEGTIVVTQYANQVTVQASYGSRVYDGTELTNSDCIVSGLPADHTIEVVATGSATTVAQGSISGNNPVGTVVIRNSSGIDVTASFPVVTVPGTLVINPAPLLASVNDNAVVFGDNPPTFGVVYTGFVFGEDISVVTTPTGFDCNYSAGDDAGIYPIIGSGAQAANYTINYLPGNLTVQKDSAPIVVIGAHDSKTYDGIALVNPSYTVSGLPAGYTLSATVTGSAITVADSIADNNVVSNVQVLSGATDVTANFSDITILHGTLAITKAPLLANVNDEAVVFGDDPPIYSATYTGFVNGEGESVLTTPITLVGTYVMGDNMGTYPIIGSDAAADNYEINYIQGFLTVESNTTPLTVIGAHASKVYDSTPLTATGVTVLGALPSGYTLSAAATGSITDVAESVSDNNPVGPITIWDGVVDVTSNFSNIASVPGTLLITPAPLTAEAIDQTITYLDPIPSYSLAYMGFVGGQGAEVLTLASPATSGYVVGSPAGNYGISGYVATAANYQVNFLPGTLAVQADSLDIVLTAASAMKSYDGTPLTDSSYTSNPSDLSTVLPVGHSLIATVSGSVTNVADAAPGNNQITSVLILNSIGDDVTSSFSNIATVPGDLTITPVPLSATMDSVFVNAGTLSPTYPVTYSGWVNGEGEAVLGASTVGTSGYSPSDPVGSTWIITGSGAIAQFDNYVIEYQPGMLFVNDTESVVILVAPSATKTYDGLPLTTTGIVSSGLPAGFTVEGVVVGSVTNVADSAIFNNDIVSYIIRNAQGDDVTASFVNVETVEGSLSIMPRAVVIDANDVAKIKGDKDPALTATVLNAIATGNPLVFALERAPGELVGNYAINVTSLSDNPNYAVTTRQGVFTITAAKELSTTGDDTGRFGGINGIALLVLCAVVFGIGAIISQRMSRRIKSRNRKIR